jgi:hypothetical protein
MPFQPGFELAEAAALIAMIAQLEGATPPLTPPPFPAGWASLYQSPQLGIFDNMWEVLHDPPPGSGRFAVLIRGTVDQSGSIVDDLLSVMITAAGTVLGRDYRFAVDPMAGVHMGFALAALVVLWDPTDGILARLPEFCPAGSEVYIAGHSQGAAIASLVRSYLANLPAGQAPAYSHKTYTFALPRPGNGHYASEYNAAFANGGMAYRVSNSQDWVPQVPLTLESLSDVNTPNPLSVWLTDRIILAPINEAIRLLRDAMSIAQVARHKPQLDHLSRKLDSVPLAAAAAMGIKADLPTILPTLDFEACGSPYSLIGVPGKNPSDPNDFFWQHHAAMYYDLLEGIPHAYGLRLVRDAAPAVGRHAPRGDGAVV